jgi:hypothetical protein
MERCNVKDNELFELPPELLFRILRYLDPVASLCFSLTCRGAYNETKAQILQGRLPPTPTHLEQRVSKPWGALTGGTQFNTETDLMEVWMRDRYREWKCMHWVYVVEDKWDPRRLIKYVP